MLSWIYLPCIEVLLLIFPRDQGTFFYHSHSSDKQTTMDCHLFDSEPLGTLDQHTVTHEDRVNRPSWIGRYKTPLSEAADRQENKRICGLSWRRGGPIAPYLSVSLLLFRPVLPPGAAIGKKWSWTMIHSSKWWVYHQFSFREEGEVVVVVVVWGQG